MADVQHVAATADCWSAHHKSYIGMTLHWICSTTRKRMHAVLACSRLKGSHTYDVLKEAMMDILCKFHLEAKVVRLTKDTGSNFVKAFVQFSSEPTLLADVNVLPQEDTEDSDDDDGPVFVDTNADVPVGEELEFVGIEGLLEDNFGEAEGDDEMAVPLPPHMRCSAHTLNLVASSDSEKAFSDGPYKTACRRAMAKAQALWNAQSRSTQHADAIHAELKKRLTVPNATRKEANIYIKGKKLIF